MTRAGVAELKASLSEYLRRVKAGEEVIVTEHGRPVARLVPVIRTGEPGSADRERLIADGILEPRRREPDAAFLADLFATPEIADPQGLVRRALAEERAAGR